MYKHKILSKNPLIVGVFHTTNAGYFLVKCFGPDAESMSILIEQMLNEKPSPILNGLLKMWRDKADDIDDDCRMLCENHAAFAHAGGMILGIQTVAQEIRRSIDGYIYDSKNDE